ncbi:hypothetical protein CRG98_015169 [Punica granatum]|uniref:Uncharacterized protein n=1 Tax=Punica granatum TaxID=22663 RepID=A0A2I0K7C4_PUNGR|nr:hypothetical protein CRG98_015169 [Punica granatum]
MAPPPRHYPIPYLHVTPSEREREKDCSSIGRPSSPHRSQIQRPQSLKQKEDRESLDRERQRPERESLCLCVCVRSGAVGWLLCLDWGNLLLLLLLSLGLCSVAGQWPPDLSAEASRGFSLRGPWGEEGAVSSPASSIAGSLFLISSSGEFGLFDFDESVVCPIPVVT